MRRTTMAIVGLVCVVLIGGCGPAATPQPVDPQAAASAAARSSEEAAAEARRVASNSAAEASASAAAAASSSAAASASAAAASAAAVGYTITCRPKDFTQTTGTFATLDQAWAAHGDWSGCDAALGPAYAPTPTDLAAVASYKKFVPDETVQGALTTMLGICANSSATDNDLASWNNVVLHGAALLCPNAPHAPLITARGNGDVFDDGTYVVGQDIKAGTYSTAPGVQGCYWERTTSGGSTITNDFVEFAPQGVTVTIRASDGGFVSRECGTWHRVR